MPTFDWRNPYPTERSPVFARNVVATSQPLAAQAGLKLLAQGGNAVDAAVGAAAVIALTEPCSNGLGSDNFAIVWDGTQLHGLNASGTAPAAWSLDFFKKKYGDDLPAKRPVRGWDTITVPGAVAGWAALHGKLGKLPFADVLAPAIEYAERGFALSRIVAEKWGLGAPLLKDQPGFAEHFMPHGRAPLVGEHFTLPGAARALKLIAQSKGEAFYRGEIAAAIAAYARQTGGSLTEADLAAYKPEWVTPIAQDFAGHTLHEIPPNGQGIAALIALGILNHVDLNGVKVDSADWHHLMIEAMKLAFADVYAYVADPKGGMQLTPEQMLDAKYLKTRAELINRSTAQAFMPGKPAGGGTIYLTAADERGMMVSFIQSNYMGFGSGVVVPGWGVSLQNRGHAFHLDAAHPNCVAPGKRPFHTIIPAFLTQGGQPVMSFGVMGGNMQPQGHMQTLTRMLLAGQNPQAACDAPRWKFMQGLDIEVEHTMPAAVVSELVARGHKITQANDSYMDFGSGQFIWRLGDPAREGYVAASDSRRDGLAAGF
ncbi:gamma-glutamyltransferase family protein [Piscinibacterium candidicorallinum]|uniref:Gamma-glutamyltransferase family protein n=1 Tax=Piscinibacterium candidicorallinum TaxID=1793872 RepID=A0ABV7GXR7_9BURK